MKDDEYQFRVGDIVREKEFITIGCDEQMTGIVVSVDSTFHMNERVIHDSYIDFREWSACKLLDDNTVAEGSDEQEVRSLTLECRNLVFISIAASIVAGNGGGTVYVGFHREPDNIMPDCSPNFLNNVNSLVQSSTYSPINIRAPFLELGYFKENLITGYFSKDLIERTHYCHEAKTCGVCDKCLQVKAILRKYML